jgi:hypothetical protein
MSILALWVILCDITQLLSLLFVCFYCWDTGTWKSVSYHMHHWPWFQVVMLFTMLLQITRQSPNKYSILQLWGWIMVAVFAKENVYHYSGVVLFSTGYLLGFPEMIPQQKQQRIILGAYLLACIYVVLFGVWLHFEYHTTAVQCEWASILCYSVSQWRLYWTCLH